MKLWELLKGRKVPAGSYVITSGINGFYEPFERLVTEVTANELNLVLAGDYIDDGLESDKVLDLIHKLHSEHQVSVIKGDHEDLLLTFIKKDYTSIKSSLDFKEQLLPLEDLLLTDTVKSSVPLSYALRDNWLFNGGLNTVNALLGEHYVLSDLTLDILIAIQQRVAIDPKVQFLKDLPDFLELPTMIVTHGGVDLTLGKAWKTSDQVTLKHGDNQFIYSPVNETDKPIYAGQSPVGMADMMTPVIKLRGNKYTLNSNFIEGKPYLNVAVVKPDGTLYKGIQYN